MIAMTKMDAIAEIFGDMESLWPTTASNYYSSDWRWRVTLADKITYYPELTPALDTIFGVGGSVIAFWPMHENDEPTPQWRIEIENMSWTGLIITLSAVLMSEKYNWSLVNNGDEP